MEINKMHHRVGSIFWLVIGFYTAAHAYQLGLGHSYHPGPGFIFFWAASFLIFFAVIDLAGTFPGKQKVDKEKKEVPIWSGLRWRRVLLVLVGLSAYTYFLSLVGFWVSTFLLMIFLFKGVEPTKWWIAIVDSIITIFLSYVIFKVWLLVEFPTGFLGF